MTMIPYSLCSFTVQEITIVIVLNIVMYMANIALLGHRSIYACAESCLNMSFCASKTKTSFGERGSIKEAFKKKLLMNTVTSLL